MSLKSDQALANTKRKLRLLEVSCQEASSDTVDPHLREVETSSLKRLINQLKEEIARYEAHMPTERS